ncbi:PqiC family protein [Opitutus terrae]|uniref:ABC-type transport auxiliary lipoprotein component domain-containing protein n=1 Tax=Opitutus terrae (strain DSM 11246 / JCM 15787 / PB90-1) TaxID=452637 RepID=B2A0D9_OPITP|nr:ABC-type transport auxiliary lipoprotein family protein [Opitutus terrae]ACB77892.1 protein of unknown function DUF330 [Opitutus terrae PB90-1]
MNRTGHLKQLEPTRMSSLWKPALAGSLLVGMLTGCSLPEAQPDLTRFYVLTPTLAAAEMAKPAEAAPRVLLRGVMVPEFLRGKIMPVRLSDTELRYIDQARWAEPLEAGLQRTLKVDLERSGRVRVVGRGSEPHDFEIALQVRQCEGVVPGRVARLAARIEVYSGDVEAKLVAQDEFTTEIAGWDGANHAELAKKLSEAAAQLAQRVADLLPAK